MKILGIHGGFSVNQHDAGAALIVDGSLVCCVEEERLIRIKSPRGFLPIESISSCLREASLSLEDIDLIVLPGETYADVVDRTRSYLTHYFKYCPPIRTINHQLAHLASAFYCSPYDDAMCISYDAYGDKLSAALAIASKKDGIKILETRPYDNSLGHFYATITSFLGFYPGEDEYKVMGLAPYATSPVDFSFMGSARSDGYKIDNKYIRFDPAPSFQEPFYTELLVDKIGDPRRKSDSMTDHHKNIAGGAQLALNKMALSLVEYLYKLSGNRRLCLAGGVALNCSLNRHINDLEFVDELFVQPSASDRGLALGCALQAAFEEGDEIKQIAHVFYGPSSSAVSIERDIKLSGVKAVFTDDPSGLAAEKLSQGRIVGWYQGRSEFGPRALGHRSILANASIDNMKDQINSKVKFREEFRPFAPSIREERAPDIFDLNRPSPFMTCAFNVKTEWVTRLPSVTHVDLTARVQTVNSKIDPLYYDLIKKFEDQSGCPAVLNTSFNIKGQPIVETPLEAISTFYSTGLNDLVIGNYHISKDNG